MKRVLILVEGQTEETFVREILQHHFWARGIHIEPKLATTKRVRSGQNYKGGVLSYGKVRFDLIQLLRDTSAVIVTTMIDFYGLEGKDFPGCDTMKGSCYDKVKHVEEKFSEDIAHHRFLPYLALHEYEALLFCKPESIVRGMLLEDAEITAKLEQIKASYSSPEEINLNDPPSDRIEKIIPAYKKGISGVLIALDIGLDAMRSACPHFDQWIQRLENL